MANVLPKKSLRAMRRFHRDHFILVGSSVAFVCGLIAFLSLLPAYVIERFERSVATDSAEVVSLPQSTVRDDLVRAQVLAKELQPFASSTVSALPFLEEVLTARPSGVKITMMSFSRGESGTIVVSGTAPSRDEISAYRTVLASGARFQSVSVPIGALAGSEDGRFSITLTGNF